MKCRARGLRQAQAGPEIRTCPRPENRSPARGRGWRRAADDLLAFGLRDAAGYRDAHMAALARGFVLGDAQPPQFRVDFLRGLFTDVTGVEDHQERVVNA